MAAKRFVVAMAASQFFPLSLLRKKNWGPWGSHEQSWEGCISMHLCWARSYDQNPWNHMGSWSCCVVGFWIPLSLWFCEYGIHFSSSLLRGFDPFHWTVSVLILHCRLSVPGHDGAERLISAKSTIVPRLGQQPMGWKPIGQIWSRKSTCSEMLWMCIDIQYGYGCFQK